MLQTKRQIFRIYGIAILALCLTVSNGWSQVSISGPTACTQGTSYTYNVLYNGSGTVVYNGNYTWTITGGVVTGTQNTVKSGVCSNVLYSIPVSVTWNSPTGSLNIVISLGSKTINITATPQLTPGSLSPQSQTINYGNTATITGTLPTGGATSPSYTYTWMTSPDGTNYTDIPSSNTQNYTSGSLTSLTYYQRRVLENTSGQTAYSNAVWVNVYPQITNTISPATQNLISGQSSAQLTSSVSGGNGTYTYQWQSSPPGGGNWTNISGAVASTYSPGVMTTSTWYRLNVTSNSATVTSNTATVTVTTLPSGVLSVTNTTPSGSGSINSLSVSPSGGDGTYTYAWYYSTNGGSTYTLLSGVTTSTYTTGVITATTLYYVAVSSQGNTANSNVVSITIPSAPSISSNATTLCNGATATLTASGGSGSYRWYNASNTLLATGTTYATTVAGTYYAVSYTTYGFSPNSNNVAIVTLNSPNAAAITGNTNVVLNSTTQLVDAVGGGTWSSNNAGIAKTDANGVITGVATGTATITYTLTNACGTSSQQLGMTVIPLSSQIMKLGKGIDDPIITDTISLVQNTVKTTQFTQDTLYSQAHTIRNVIALRVIEETNKFIPGDFTAYVVVKIEYGHSASDIFQVDSTQLTVTYTKNAGNKYNAIHYLNFNNAEFTRVTVLRVNAPTTVNSVSFDTKQVLLLTNSLMGTRFYALADNKKPVLSYTTPSGGTVPDALSVNWVHPIHTNNNATQLEWTWLENELAGTYINGSVFDTALLFKSGASRIDIPGGAAAGSYAIPLVYAGIGKLFFRVRGVSIMPSGSRSDGPWSGVQTFAFNGHNDSLNWQMHTAFAEEGKRKTIIQYYDGSLRSRQTVTKDNYTQTTIVAESFYDAQGRAAIQVLPAPGMKNIIAYTKNFNKFNTQPDNTNPLDYFDFTTSTSGKYATSPLDTMRGASLYFSGANPEKSTTAFNKNIPDANGYAYAATRFTPDGTGRILMQGGVGDSLQLGSAHATRYYYGTAAQEELDALFGTEVGNYTHYFKNMILDANGQMSVSYTDMHGRKVATALAGQGPNALQALNIADTSLYKNQAGKVMTRNLIDKGSNVLKGNSIESVNTILVPYKTLYSFTYNLPKQILTMPTCSGTVSYNCKFDLQISISDESGDTSAFVYNFAGIDTINWTNAILLPPGSYNVRKTLTINQDSLTKFLQKYDTINVGLCRTQQFLIDSLAAADSSASGCGIAASQLTCSSCLATLGTYTTYLNNYATTLGLTVGQLNSSQLNDIRNQFVNDSTFCQSLNMNTSHTLDNIRLQMLGDMAPYSGQYAKDVGSGTMYNKYNIFSLSGSSYPQPFYKTPRNQAGVADFYYDAYGRIDSTVLPSILTGVTGANFESQFVNSWASSLLPYHPEFAKLNYAVANLQNSYNFMDSVNQSVSLAFSPNASDPFFTVVSTTTDKNAMKKFTDTSWQGGFSMWQIAYGDVFGCKTYPDSASRVPCYNAMPKTFVVTGTSINPGTGAVPLTAAMQLQAWNLFKSSYTQAREDMVNRYICLHTDTLDNRNLINQGYRIYFPYDNVQQASNSQFTTWYPNQSGVYPTVGLKDSVTKYSSHCDSYINGWRLTLLQCPAFATKIPDSTTREAVIATITARMALVCAFGTDGANPFGSSTVAPAYSGNTYTSFEQVINKVLDSLLIPRDQFCNSYVVDFPKPYGKNPVVTKQYVAGVDSCTCSQFSILQQKITNAGYNAYSLPSINQYLRTMYQDTITAVLYAGLQQCYVAFNYGCHPDSAICTDKTGTHMCYFTTCQQLSIAPLVSPQPLPQYLTCGFSDSSYSCYNCTSFKSYDTAFFSIFGRHPVFTGTITNDTVLAYNDLFAKFVNYKTGLQHNWQFYSDRFNTYGCPIGGITGTGSGLSVCMNTIPLNDTTGLVQAQAPCQVVRNRATVKAAVMFDAINQQLIADFKAAYVSKCLSAAEIFKVTDTVKEYHYTLYYYDQAGNLVKTVSPKGVNPIYRQSFIDSVENFKNAGLTLTPSHSLVTRYCYNSLNQIIIQKSPDGGTVKLWYDRLGRIVASQNAKQAVLGNVYSYTMYDSLGRMTQVGQITGGTAMSDATAKNDANLLTWFTNATASRSQITVTVYDTAYGPTNGVALGQSNVRSRVSYTQQFNNAADVYPASATYYNYDIHGNIDTVLKDFGNRAGVINAMNLGNDRFKTIAYCYDLISGKVNSMSYQPGQPDAYYQRYLYDAENRLTDVYSGRDSVMLLLFTEREAHYTYYKHGWLARNDLGQLRLQGIDYAYTLQGWIKGVNPAMGGTLTNGTDTSEGFPVAADVFGYSLNYYKNDYRAIGLPPQTTSIMAALGANAAPLYNGNIAAMGVNLPKLGTTKLYNYHYDQLNRMVAMDVYNGLVPAAGTFTPASVTDYQERVAYDANGNILSYSRNGDASRTAMDNLTYTYKPATNQLDKVVDVAADASAGNYPLYNDLKQGQAGANYQYDPMGNLIVDNSEGITNISWTVAGKISSITKSGAVIRYVYDELGNRIMKQTAADTTIYVRDASGNVMSVYVKPAGGSLVQSEIDIYGGKRIGMSLQHVATTDTLFLGGTFGKAIRAVFTREEKIFELSNHLGNVLVTVSDRRVQISAGGTTVDSYAADIMTASDYYPFGMIMPGRNFTSGNDYRYGFNGKEKDKNASSLTEYDYGFRIYNPVLGKFLSTDPLAKAYPWYTPYQFAGDKPIMAIDIDGMEEKVMIMVSSSETKPTNCPQTAVSVFDQMKSRNDAVNAILSLLQLEDLKRPKEPMSVVEFGTCGELTVKEKREIIEQTVSEFIVKVSANKTRTRDFNPNTVTDTYTEVYDFNYSLLGNKEKIDEIKKAIKTATTVIEYADKYNEITKKLPMVENIAPGSSIVGHLLEKDDLGVAKDIAEVLVKKALPYIGKKLPSFAPVATFLLSKPFTMTLTMTFANSAPEYHFDEIKEQRTDELKMRTIGALLFLFENNNKPYVKQGTDILNYQPKPAVDKTYVAPSNNFNR
ncbi:MAG: hypothetical protein C5B52_05040 [Bacteroidetes bacterium]|nr:MAG: hypothetical protein C5B52_05040 [Bacteroidota bacterium]